MEPLTYEQRLANMKKKDSGNVVPVVVKEPVVIDEERVGELPWEDELSIMDSRLLKGIEEGKTKEDYYNQDEMTDIFGQPMRRSKEDSPVYQRALAEARRLDEVNNTTTEVERVEGDRQKMDDFLDSRKVNFAQQFKDASVDVNDLLMSDNPLESAFTEGLLNAGFEADTISAIMTTANFTPFVGPAIGLADLKQNISSIKEDIANGDYNSAGKTAGISLLEVGTSLLGGRAVVKSVKNNLMEKNISKAKQGFIKSAGGADLAAREVAAVTSANATRVALDNRALGDQLIKEFEAKVGKTISVQDGKHLKIDEGKAREAGKETLSEITERDGDLFNLNLGESVITSPILNPNKFDGIVAVASELEKKYPGSFDPDKTIIDNLVDLTVSKKLDGQALVNLLDDYGLNFEDYVLTIVGSGSEAGKVLNNLSQIRRLKPDAIMRIDKDATTLATDGDWRHRIMRVENIRRGGLVSQIATASRNLQSGAIRLPMESLGNVMDQAIYNMQYGTEGDKLFRMVDTVFSGKVWRDSFRGMKYVFSRPDVAKDYTDLIMRSPELAKQNSTLLNNLNEIQKLSGRGKGGLEDKILSALEDGVDFLNTPNRWQEHLMRRGIFFSELQRLSKREFGIDLIDELQKGNLKGLLNDSSNVIKRGKNQRSFLSLVDDSVQKSLDITYAKQPDSEVFRSVSTFITRNGLTVIMPFPRFMFNAMELMGQYAGGASIPLAQKISSVVTGGKVGGGPLTAKGRQRIQRNLQGIAAVGAAYQYRTSKDAPTEFNEVPVGDKAVMNTTATFPLAQYLYAGEAIKRLMDGTFSTWFDTKEFVELFTGSNFRTGVGNSVLEEIAELANATDLTAGETAGRLIGRPLGNYLSTWGVAFGQIIDAERATGVRGTEFKETAQDPTFSFVGSLGKNLVQPLRNRGMITTPSQEATMPDKEYAGFYDGRERMYPGMKFLGLSMTTTPTEDKEYLGNFGIDWRILSSKSKVPSIKNYEIRMLNNFLPIIVELGRKQEDKLRLEYSEQSDTFQKEFTSNEYVSNKLRPLLKAQISKYKTKISSVSKVKGDAYTRAMIEYRKTPKEFRKLATTEFIKRGINRGNRVPDPLNADDLKELAIIGKAYKNAYSK